MVLTKVFFGKKLRLICKKSPGFTMIFAYTILIKGFPVFGSSISFIACPVIMWEFFMEFCHVFIPVSFCKDTCRCNRSIKAISLNDTTVRKSFILYKIISVDQQQLRFWLQLLYGDMHGFYRCLQNIDTVNFFMTDAGNRKTDRFFF